MLILYIAELENSLFTVLIKSVEQATKNICWINYLGFWTDVFLISNVDVYSSESSNFFSACSL